MQTASAFSSITWRVIMQAVILTAFIIVVLTTVSFVVSRNMLEQSIRTQLSSVAAVAEDSMEEILRQHRERASLLSAHADVQSILRGSSPSGSIDRLMATLRRDEEAILSIEVYDGEGALLARAGEAVGLPVEALNVPVYRPVLSESGWDYYDVFTPVWAQGGNKIGVLGMRYDSSSALESLLNVVPAIGQTAEALLAMETASGLTLLHPSLNPDDSYVLTMDAASSPALQSAASGQEGVERSSDYRGRDTVIAYRYLPALGWGMAIHMDRAEAFADVRRLALSHILIGGLITVLATILAYLLAHQLTAPLRTLTEKVRTLRPGHWNIARSVDSGDEVEVLDRVTVDLANRLKTIYDHLEEEIDARTKELKRQFELDGAILQTINYGVMTVDADGKVTTINPAAETMLLLSKHEAMQRDIQSVLALRGHRGDALKSEHPVLESLATNESIRSPANTHLNIQRPDESLLPVMFSVSPLHEGAVVSGAIVVFNDITEERKLDYLKSEFITLASHQLRTPLSALRWYVELFSEEKKLLTANQQSYLHEMNNAIGRMVALLSSLLNTAKLEGNDVEPSMQTVDLRELMREMTQDCQSIANGSGQICSLVEPGDAVPVTTDPTLLRIVLQNLISNAAKYAGRKAGATGTIALSLVVADGRARISVSDDGVGIPKDEQPRVFQKFFRAKNVRKMDTDGNGLGLYISRSIIERLGGSISFESAENKGTTFTVTVPLKDLRVAK